MRAGDGWAACLVVTGYPAQVGPGWLEPLLSHPGRLDVSLHIEPVPQPIAADRLRKQRARLESARRHRARHDRLDDPATEAAATDAADLAGRVARREGRLFRLGLTITVHAPTRDRLDAEVAEVRAVAASLLLDAHPTTWRAAQAYVTGLPLGVDLLGQHRTFDTTALAAAFPFSSADLPASDPAHPGHTSGVFLGANAASPGVVVADRWRDDNYNSVILAHSGAGKSYYAKLELLHWLYQHVHACVVDPDGEYVRLAHAVGGTVIPVGAPDVRLNPFDLPDPDRATADALTRQVLFGHTLLALLFGADLDPAQTAAADAAILGAYRAAGITTDPATWRRRAPLLADVQHQLAQDPTHQAALDLAHRLSPYTTGSFSSLFCGPTTTPADGHLVVFDLSHTPDELRTLCGVLALDTIWRQVSDPTSRRRRLITIDEGWQLLSTPACARYVYRLVKSVRKYFAGVTVVSQDAEDLLASPLGASIVHNAATAVLLGQSPSAIDQITDTFGLTTGEAHALLTAARGEGLLVAGRDRVALCALASDAEHALITTDPAELALLDTSARS